MKFKLYLYFVGFISLLVVNSMVQAQDVFQEQLVVPGELIQNRTNIEREIEINAAQLEQMQLRHEQIQSTLQIDQIPALREEATRQIELAQIHLSNLSLDISVSQARITQLNEHVLVLQREGVTEILFRGQRDPLNELSLAQNKEALAEEQERLALLGQARHQVQLMVDEQNAWLLTLSEFESNAEHMERLITYQKQRADLVNLIAHWNQILLEINNDLLLLSHQPQEQAHDERETLEQALFNARQSHDLASIQLSMLNVEYELASIADELPEYTVRGYVERDFQQRINILEVQLNRLALLINAKVSLLQRQIEVRPRDGLTEQLPSQSEDSIQSKINTYQQIQAVLAQDIDRIADYQQQVGVAYDLGLMVRQPLPRTLTQWYYLGSELSTIPWSTVQALIDEFDRLQIRLSQLSAWHLLLIVVLEMIWVVLSIVLWRVLRRSLSMEEADIGSFSARFVHFIAVAFARYLLDYLFLVILIALVWLSLLSRAQLSLMIGLGLIWLVFKTAIGVARVALFENIKEIGGRDVKLYHGLKWAFILGGILSAITFLAHHSLLAPDVIGFVDRFFMIVLLAISYPLLRGWEVVPAMITPHLGNRHYLRRIIRLLGLLIPLTIFSNAAIGLIGYVNLAWRIGVVEGQILIALTIGIMLRGVLNDVMVWLSEYFIRRIANGWLWTQSLLKPLHNVLNFGLIVAIVGSLVWLLGGQQHILFSQVQQLLTYSYFEVGSNHTPFSTLSLIIFVLILLVVIWATKWSREFSYRWLYGGVKDSVVRDSLSILTQYGVAVVGGFILLNSVGIDFATLQIGIGVFAIGVAFGIRDIVSNLLCGLILLIERPIRTGDRIRVSDNEGIVTNIGMRAVTIKTFDNVEVIVPNATTITEPFTNLTFKDNIVRTEIKLRTSFNENPNQIRVIISETVNKHEAVLDNPPARVFLDSIGESANMYSILYFVDLSKYPRLMETKSDILYRIWEALRHAEVKIPYPRSIVHVQHEDDS